MKGLVDGVRKIFVVGGWAPLLVFFVHVVLSRGLHAYDAWPPTDRPMHFAGGVAMAFFISRCFQALPREAVRHSRVSLLELILAGSLTATAAVLWEFAEFSCDQVFGTNIQVGLANTMQDLALGLAGAATFVAVRARRLGTGPAVLQEVANEWMNGRVAA